MIKRIILVIFCVVVMVISVFTQEQNDIVYSFINKDIFGNIQIDDISNTESLLQILGKPINIEKLKTEFKYEGEKIDSLNVLEFEKYNVVFYQINGYKDIFGYFELKNNYYYSHFNIGSFLSEIINIDGKSIRTFSIKNKQYYIFDRKHNKVDCSLIIELNEIGQIGYAHIIFP
jgi:hypothetical protein